MSPVVGNMPEEVTKYMFYVEITHMISNMVCVRACTRAYVCVLACVRAYLCVRVWVCMYVFVCVFVCVWW